MLFLRKARLDTEPLPIKMSGVRMGERLLQIGVDDPKLLASMALKTGLSGSTSVAVTDEASAARARAGAAGAGALIDLHVTNLDPLPFDNDAFDVVVVNGRNGWLAALNDEGRTIRALRETRRVLRHGGRIIVIEAGPKGGFAGVLSPYRPDPGYAATGGTTAALQAAGFKPVRLLWDREGYRFTEGLKS
ncbi:MAG TPA: methyltransferase domain-containing protein [Vicinamibacterales bacterium]